MTAPANPAPAGWPASTGQARPVEDRPPDSATVLLRLRGAFPCWAFLHDARYGRWIACRGTRESGVTLVKADPVALRMAVAEIEGQRG